MTPFTTYWYRIVATNLVGSSVPLPAIKVGTFPPSPPADFAGTVASTTQINLKWTDKSSDETGFEIDRGTSSTNLTRIVTTARNATTYDNTGLTANTTYFFRMRAVNGVDKSPDTYIISLKTAAPSAPMVLTAQVMSSTRADLFWQDTANTESRFLIERSTSATSGFAQVATTPANVTTFSNTGLTSGGTFYYRVKAENGAGASAAWSNTLKVILTAPPAPTTLAAVPASSNAINLTWLDKSEQENGFRIERSGNGTSG